MSREQRAKLGKTSSESFAMLQQVYGEETMSRTRAFEWHKRFKEGQVEIEDDPRSGRPSTSRTADNIERVKQMVRTDHRLMVRMIAEELSINKDTVWSIITENLEMRKVCAKMVLVDRGWVVDRDGERNGCWLFVGGFVGCKDLIT